MTIRLVGRAKNKNNTVQPSVLTKESTNLNEEQMIQRVASLKNALKNEKVRTYFGQDAINKLITLNVLKHGQSTCRNPFKTVAKKVWVNNGHDWMNTELIKCTQFLFWQIENTPPQCSSCNSWYEKHDESEIIAWYQTKERNFDESKFYLFTYAEKIWNKSNTLRMKNI